MKTNLHFVAAFAYLTSCGAQAIGLGDLEVNSYLNQPFQGEIKLLDVGYLSLTDIKANLASLEEYKRVGLEQGFDVTFIEFSVIKNKQGKTVIQLSSSNRIDEPYFQMLVDLIWPTGELFQEYTILLDPPGYQFSKVVVSGQAHPLSSRSVLEERAIDRAQSGLRGETKYGPVDTKSETIWEIAQRHDSDGLNLQQIVLGILGENPDAFAGGNLNGLKNGVTLTIPAASTMKQIPAEAAIEEVKAQDEAWKNKTEIKHYLNPPYFTGTESGQETLQGQQLNSAIPAISSGSEGVAAEPQLSAEPPKEEAPILSSLNKASGFFSVEQPPSTTLQKENELKSEIAVAKTAVDSVREANATLGEQIKILQTQTEKLQQQIDKKDNLLEHRDQEIQRLRELLEKVNTERMSVLTQSQSVSGESSINWLLWTILILTLFVAAIAYYLKESIEPYVQEMYKKLRLKLSKQEIEKPQEKTVETTPSAETEAQVVLPVEANIAALAAEEDAVKKTQASSTQEGPPKNEVSPEVMVEKQLEEEQKQKDILVLEEEQKLREIQPAQTSSQIQNLAQKSKEDLDLEESQKNLSQQDSLLKEAPLMQESLTSKEAPLTQESLTSKEAPMMQESLTSKEAPMMQESLTSKEAPMMQESLTSKEAPMTKESLTSKEAPMIQESSDLEETLEQNLASKEMTRPENLSQEESAENSPSRDSMTLTSPNLEEMPENSQSKDSMILTSPNLEEMPESSPSKDSMTLTSLSLEEMPESSPSKDSMTLTSLSLEEMPESSPSKDSMSLPSEEIKPLNLEITEKGENLQLESEESQNPPKDLQKPQEAKRENQENRDQSSIQEKANKFEFEVEDEEEEPQASTAKKFEFEVEDEEAQSQVTKKFEFEAEETSGSEDQDFNLETEREEIQEKSKSDREIEEENIGEFRFEAEDDSTTGTLQDEYEFEVDDVDIEEFKFDEDTDSLHKFKFEDLDNEQESSSKFKYSEEESEEEFDFDFEDEFSDVKGDAAVSDDVSTQGSLKSAKAFDTLLSLAETYLSMGDVDTARQSLEEVLENGTDSQKEKAKELLAQIKNK